MLSWGGRKEGRDAPLRAATPVSFPPTLRRLCGAVFAVNAATAYSHGAVGRPASRNVAVTEMMTNAGSVCLINTPSLPDED